MSIDALIRERFRRLTPEHQKELLLFIEFLTQREEGGIERESVEGLWADQDVEIKEDELDAARREMWRGQV